MEVLGEEREKRMAWWREAKFGMFIHWGLYSIPAGIWKGRLIPGLGEWIQYNARIPVREYEQLAKHFNPVKFNADEWVGIARDAGMRYMVITAKHHDGFCMFHTELTDYNIVDATPFKRDPMKELAEACEREGIKFGFYYSQLLDWHHPNGAGNNWDYDPNKKNFMRYLEDYVKPQLRELLTNYGPIAIVWFDIYSPTPEIARDLRDWVHKFQPEAIVNGRVDPGRWDAGIGDYIEMGDNEIPERGVMGYWETPATINDTWGFKSYDHNWKSPGVIIQKLVEIVSKGGNYLLNVGPTAEGVIPEPSVRNLREVGAWLRRNGESIYGAKASPIDTRPDEPYRFTAKPGRLYVHILAWPWDGELRLTGVKNRVSRAYLLADQSDGELRFEQDGSEVRLHLDQRPVDPVDNVVVLEMSSKDWP
ncbi:alpha-L-fucosidase [Candidatus Bathyarchaeota archaeon]|nr:alpha-L-fucosidase [Candidatus Bathyarchaeota archaeon]